jgi:hypothetical protein
MIDIDTIKVRVQSLQRHAGVTDYASQVIRDAFALVAEVEQLREHRESCTANLLKGYETGRAEERAAAVASLRQEAEAEAQTYTVQAAEWARRIDNIADCIERGEHRSEGDE